MKKTTLVTTLLTAAFVFVCTGCAEKKETPVDTTPFVSEEQQIDIDISVFEEVEASSENLNVYRKEVSRRLDSLEEAENFITDEEWQAISSEWNSAQNIYRHSRYFTTFDKLYEESSVYYYPVVYREGTSLIMWYTTESGSVHLKEVYGNWRGSSNYLGYLHSDSKDYYMSNGTEYDLTYIQETGTVSVWKFGENIKSYELPANAVYCGSSHFEGYIFRSGTDVYSLKAEGTYNGDGSVVCIAHNVAYIIDADYYYGSDPWCQPLFQMTDGSIKAYIGWEDENGAAAPDNVCHLFDLQYEGSYDK